MHNVFEILKTYRQIIRGIQYDFMRSRQQARHQHRQHDLIMIKAIHFLSNTTVQLTEVEALYHGYRP